MRLVVTMQQDGTVWIRSHDGLRSMWLDEREWRELARRLRQLGLNLPPKVTAPDGAYSTGSNRA